MFCDKVDLVKVKVMALIKRFTLMDWLILWLLLVLLLYLVVIGVTRSLRKIPAVEYLAKTEEINGNKANQDIWVDVSGAVVSPGVYKLSEGARVKDALVAAGGFSSTADRPIVAREVNLAAVVSDGQKIYIQAVSDEKPAAGNVMGATTSKINLNTASLTQLDSLYGVGQIRAEQIVKNRPYTKVDELVTKKVLTKAVFEKIRDQISVY